MDDLFFRRSHPKKNYKIYTSNSLTFVPGKKSGCKFSFKMLYNTYEVNNDSDTVFVMFQWMKFSSKKKEVDFFWNSVFLPVILNQSYYFPMVCCNKLLN